MLAVSAAADIIPSRRDDENLSGLRLRGTGSYSKWSGPHRDTPTDVRIKENNKKEKNTMKRMKRVLALVLVMIMVFSLNITAFASSDDPEVTVYLTTNMFTKGGYDPAHQYDPDHGITVPELKDENPACHPFDQTEPIDVDWDTIEVFLDDIRDSTTGYNAPTTLSSDVNALDAIWFALMMEGYVPSGGWDSISTTPGGYIHQVYPNGIPTTGQTTIVNIAGVDYYKFTGTGWRIALKYPNGDWHEAAAYGTYFTIVDGMQIIFDISEYEIYDRVPPTP